MKKPFKNIILKIALSFLLLAIASLLIPYPAENADKNPLPEDKSPAIVYLMSEKSNKLNGEQITLSSA
jgi:hypothetical protein